MPASEMGDASNSAQGCLAAGISAGTDVVSLFLPLRVICFKMSCLRSFNFDWHLLMLFNDLSHLLHKTASGLLHSTGISPKSKRTPFAIEQLGLCRIFLLLLSSAASRQRQQQTALIFRGEREVELITLIREGWGCCCNWHFHS